MSDRSSSPPLRLFKGPAAIFPEVCAEFTRNPETKPTAAIISTRPEREAV